VLAELAPVTAQERAEALNIAGLYVRRSRLVKLEALALSHGTQARLLPPESSGGPRVPALSAARAAGGRPGAPAGSGRTCDGGPGAAVNGPGVRRCSGGGCGRAAGLPRHRRRALSARRP